MKILFVTNKYPPYIGGAQTQLQVLARYIAKTNTAMVAMLSNGCETHGPMGRYLKKLGKARGVNNPTAECLNIERRRFIDQGVQVSTIGISTFDKLRLIATNGSRTNEIIKGYLYAKMIDADVVHCVKPDWLGFIAKEAASAAGVPFTIAPYIHETSVKHKYKFLLQASDVVFALSEADTKRLIEIGVNRDQIRIMGVVPLVTRGGNSRKFRSTHGLYDSPMVLFIGRLIGYKGVGAILEAARLVWTRHPTTRFVFIGPDGDSTKLLQKHLDEKVLYLGCVSEAEKADALAACDLFCMPSTYEILPSVYLEAWCYAKPVIGGPAYGLKELIEDNEAGLVAPQEPASLASAIVKLLDDKELQSRMGRAGNAFVTSQYSVESISSRMLAAYNAAMDFHRTRLTKSK